MTETPADAAFDAWCDETDPPTPEEDGARAYFTDGYNAAMNTLRQEYPIRPPVPEWPLTEDGWYRMWSDFYDRQDALMALLLARLEDRP